MKRSYKKKRKKSRTLADYKKEAWYFLSLYCRLHWAKDNGFVTCITTNQEIYYYGSNLDCGHFVPRSTSSYCSLLFDNVFPQSKGSNMKTSGDNYIMGRAINQLHKKSKTRYSADQLVDEIQYKDIKLNKVVLLGKIKYFKENVLRLSKEKNLWEWKKGCLKKYLKDVEI